MTTADMTREGRERRIARVAGMLAGEDAGRRRKAEAEMLEMGADAVPALLLALGQLPRNRSQSTRVLARRALLWGLLYLVVGLSLRLLMPHLSMVPAVTTPLIFVAAQSLEWRKARNNAARILTRYSDPRIAGPLAEAMELADRATRARIADALAELLPRFRASDAALLTGDQRACLRRALAGRHARLALGALAALHEVGDADALPAVERLARGEGTARDATLRQAAQESLPAFEAMARQERERQTLLRPASEPGNGAGVLLRPARGGSADVETERLLRPAGDGQG